ncbi:Xaa-Pro dipeptidyl-peptidase [Actinomadura macrotermitis]|uniref:Xaa-Pro dipeptidyl-peptidase n=1 Tax=Actinomadura macrotermitis TaxID=2585200 RepID=A0A7K0C537_9ACTN|nr:Xaa-Pro dipeptidyl-peptidase [Actinomadura macrotermitis]MQY07944.1 Xaa-Pro dipeptidyl-peptidase [Actinomadura macrotermitis]
MPRRTPRPAPLAAFTVLTVAAAATLGTGGTAAARAVLHIVVKDGVTQPVFSYKDAIREHVYVESPLDSDNDGKKDRINVDIVRPKETRQGLRVPVVMDASPYYDNVGRGNEGEKKAYDADGNPAKFPLFYDNYFVPRGYAFLAVDMAGTTRSEGCPVTGGPSDVLGVKAVIDWLNGRAKGFTAAGEAVKADWTTGRTGMIGKSYDGTLANGVASTGVRGLETIVPISAISSWYDYSRSNGVKYSNGYQPYLARVVDTDPPAKCQAVRDAMHQGEDDATGNYNAYWKTADYRHGTIGDVRNVRASVFAYHGVNDLNVKTDHFAKWWQGLAANGVRRKVWLSQRGHVDPFDIRRDLWVNTLHKWFDHELHKIPNDALRGPRADIEVGPDQWITQPDWPSRAARPVTVRPAADGSLGLKPATKGATASFTDAPGPQGGGYTEDELVADPTTAKPYRLAYVSAPLPRTGRLSGSPTAKLRVSLDKPTANLTAMLVDYGEDTRVDYLGPGSGIQTLTTEDCHGESTPADDACYRQTRTRTVTSAVNVVARGWLDAQNRTSLSRPAPLTPGKYYSVRWQTLAQEYVFKKGHRLALVLAGTDYDYNDDTATGAKVTVDLAGSSITVPVVLGEDASALVAPQPRGVWKGPQHVKLPRQEKKLY